MKPTDGSVTGQARIHAAQDRRHLRLTARARVGWMLRVNRVLCAHREFARLGAFADVFVTSDDSVALSTLSRWENGLIAMPRWAPARYEAVLGLPQGLLTGTADTAFRYHTPPTVTGSLWAHRRPPPGEGLDELIEIAVGTTAMSSQNWDKLSEFIAARPHLVLSPTATWDRLSERLLIEMSIADGAAWMTRAEAYHRLISHPTGQHHAITTATDAAADRSAQSMIGTLSVFTASAHPEASRAVIRQVTDPTTIRTFYGALLTSAKKLRYGHFSSAQALTLLPILVELLDGSREEAGLAARLLLMVPAGMRARIPHRLTAALNNALASPVSHTTRTLCDNAERDLSDVGQPRTDKVLPLLVDEMLTDPVFDVRLCAMFLIYATPYRYPLARALAVELQSLQRRRGDQQVILRLLESLRVLGGPAERRLVERLLLAGETSAEVRDMSAYTLGHIGGRSSDEFYRHALTANTTRWTNCGTVRDASVLDRLVYALGISRRDHVLNQVIAQPELPSSVRAAATWWTTLPPHLRQSAHQ